MKNKKVLIIVLSLFILCFLLLSSYFVYVKFFLIGENKELNSKVQMELKISKEVDFRKIIQKDFDEILILTPYTAKEFIKKKGIDLEKTRSFRNGIIIKNDIPILTEGYNVFVFVKNKKIINYGRVFENVNFEKLEKYQKDDVYLIPSDVLIEFIK